MTESHGSQEISVIRVLDFSGAFSGSDGSAGETGSRGLYKKGHQISYAVLYFKDLWQVVVKKPGKTLISKGEFPWIKLLLQPEGHF